MCTTAELLVVAAASLIACFAAWWLYFGNPHRRGPETIKGSFHWGYGHYFVFGSLGALGAGIHLAARYLTVTGHQAQAPEFAPEATATTAGNAAEAAVEHVTARVAALAVAIPVAVFILSMLLLALTVGHRRRTKLVPMFAASIIVLVTGLTMPVVVAVVASALVLVGLVIVLTVLDVPAAMAEQTAAR